MTASRPPGWYPDLWGAFPERWWDGEFWAGSPEKLGASRSSRSSGSSPTEGFVRDGDAPVNGSVRFVGGMNVPTSYGTRLNATVPLAVLTLDEGSLTLHPRPFPVPMFTDFRVALSDIAVAFRLGGGPLTSGVGVQLSDGTVGYFWTLSHGDRVIAALDGFGVPIEVAARRATGALLGQFGWLRWWTFARVTSVAELPGLSRLMMLIGPLAILAGAGLAVSSAAAGGASGWVRAVIGALVERRF
jgi:hypothetical protein